MTAFAADYVFYAPLDAEQDYDNVGCNRLATTNILSVNVSQILQEAKTLAKEPPYRCSNCQGIFSNLSAIDSGKWKCDFCGQENKSKLSPKKLKKANSTSCPTYLLSPPSKKRLAGLTVYCVDISGSMGVTTCVAQAGGWNCTKCTLQNGSVSHCVACGAQRADLKHVSRLDSIRKAIMRQMQAMTEQSPDTRVALVTFNNSVNVYTDGREPVTLKDDALLDYDGLIATGKSCAVKQPVATTIDYFAEQLDKIDATGATALGPALLVATSMASQGTGAKVIVCTDGLSNVGLGALSSDSPEFERRYAEGYFTQVRDFSLLSGVCVSVISIQGEDCNLVQLGQLAQSTGGSVVRVKANQLMECVSAASQVLLASQVSVSLVLHTQLHAFACGVPVEPAFGATGQTIVVGSCGANQELLFTFNRTPSLLLAKQAVPPPDPPARFPFQIQVEYTDDQNARFLYVESFDHPLCESRELSERGARIEMVSACATQQAAQLALRASYAESRAMAESYRAVVERLNRQQEADQMIYDNFVVAMDGLYEQLGPSDDYAEGVPLPDRAADAIFQMNRASSIRFKRRSVPGEHLYDRLSRLLPPDYQASSAEGIYDEPNSILHNDAYRDLDDPYQEPGYAVPQVGAGYLGANAISPPSSSGYEVPERK